MLVAYEDTDDHSTLWLPFGYYLDRDADLLMLRRSDGTFVAAFNTRGVDLFEVECGSRSTCCDRHLSINKPTSRGEE